MTGVDIFFMTLALICVMDIAATIFLWVRLYILPRSGKVGENGSGAFQKWKDEAYETWPREDLFPPPMKAQDGLDILGEEILGPDWYVVDPMCREQVNTEMVAAILQKLKLY